MEELQEADILWPGSGDGEQQQDRNSGVADDSAKLVSPPPVEISRRKRRCRPWASEHAMFDDEDTTDGFATDAPPHVLVARRRRLVGGRAAAAYSMCAGKGRTLKGRDLRDVRNRVLKMTGFIEK